MKKFIRDAAASLFGFPHHRVTTPDRTGRSTTHSGFIDSAAITPTLLKEMFRRNQAAHTIVEDVAKDAVPDVEFKSPEDEELPKWNAEALTIFEKFIMQPVIRAIFFTRLYGCAGILIGYADGKSISEMSKEVSATAQILYLQAIPKTWIKEIHPKKDKDGNLQLPIELDHYELNISGATQDVHASRLIHIQNQSADEESLEGETSLMCLFDTLTSLKSMDWGTGQAMWRHGAGMTVFTAPADSDDPQAQMDAIVDVTTDINAATVLVMPPGTEWDSHATGALNPKNYYSVIMEQIAIGSRIPVSILRGSVAGALSASEKDRKDYQELLHEIQKTQITPTVRNLLQRFQASGQLSEQEFKIEWKSTPTLILEEKKADLYEAQAELTKERAETERQKRGVDESSIPQ